MQTYRCDCGNRVFFENTLCLVCQRELGWCEACFRMATLDPAPGGAEGAPTTYLCGHADCRQPLRKCHNYTVENICNHCFAADAVVAPTSAINNGDSEPSAALCAACQLTETIPDLTVAGNREKWARLEAAKRRLLYTLNLLGLPYQNVEPPLSFDFKADVEPPNNEWRNAGPAEIVYTGHAEGKITINIREADDVVREKLRCEFHEAHRTLIGHFHHEIGHYFWDLLVRGQKEKKFVQLFGDHNSPSYTEAMQAYYQNGPRDDWATSFISAYASAHPWEDFAETFALYLDMISILDTASHLFALRVNFRGRAVKTLVERFQEVGILVNEFNRAAGLVDLVPDVIVAPVVEKLDFVHSLVKGATSSTQIAATAPTRSVSEGALALTSG